MESCPILQFLLRRPDAQYIHKRRSKNERSQQTRIPDDQYALGARHAYGAADGERFCTARRTGLESGRCHSLHDQCR